MVPPQGLNATDVKGKVCKLRTGLYGLKRSSRIWYEHLHSELCKCDSKQCELEPCVYIKSIEKGVVIVTIYVGDIFVFSSDAAEMQKLRKTLSNKFPLKNLGAAKNILGMRVERSNNEITLDQSNYIRDVLHRFNMQDSKLVCTPLVTGTQLEKSVCDTSFPYQSLVECLLYIGVSTRPDIIHAVSLLSPFNTC
jgi:ATP-binding cassette subfamily B (MDR/TAP) protein 1